MAEIDEPTNENITENRSQNNIFFCIKITNLAVNGFAYNTGKDFAHC